jgi:hypothetical protein
MTHHIDLNSIRLDKGSHPDEAGIGCVMEWVSIFAGLDKTDHPRCTSPVLTAFAIAFNDGVTDDTRQRLVPFIPRLVGTAGDLEADTIRAWMATDWLVRVFTPTWLRKVGLTAEAAALVALPELSGPELARQAQPIIDAALAFARADWVAARAAAGAAAWDAAGAAARAAAGDAAGAAAWDAARAAAWDAARAAAWAAAWDAAGAAARAAAGAAAWAAAGAAAWDAAGDSNKYNAAYKAARSILEEAFAETVSQLQNDALALFDRMIDVRSGVPA